MLRSFRLLAVVLVLLPLGVRAQDGPGFAELDALFETVEEGERPERRAALDELLGHGDDRITDMVLGYLGEKGTKDEETVEDLLRAVGMHKVKRGAEAALEKIGDRHAGVRSYAAVCLERLEFEEAKKELIKRAGRERNALALKNALRALGKVAPNEADVAKALLRRFRHKESVVAANAILSCGGFTEEGKVRSLLAAEVGAMLSKTSDIRVRSACFYALGSIGTEKELPALEKFEKSYTNTRNPLAQVALEVARMVKAKIRSGESDPMSDMTFARVFQTASDDERDPARDGDPTKPEPDWMGDANRGGRFGRGR